ncbi:MAG TPA: molybdenum cofactor guanylyltransferase [Baekduia sp.]|nr:molybdenum cofactor guanylyltransferase [Baekduia sp.]
MSVLTGAVLVGGAGRRIGGDKAIVALEGKPLVQWAIDAITPVVDEVVVVAKKDTLLPILAYNVSIWLETEEVQHPLSGVVHALTCASGPVLILAGDMPLLTPEILGRIARAPEAGAPARVARSAGRLQPLCARYEQTALGLLPAVHDGLRLTESVMSIDPQIEEFDDAEPFLNVNAPEDLLGAGAVLLQRDEAGSETTS